MGPASVCRHTHTVCRPVVSLVGGCIALEFGLVSLGLHYFLRLFSAGLSVALISGCCWACSAFSVQDTVCRCHGML